MFTCTGLSLALRARDKSQATLAERNDIASKGKGRFSAMTLAEMRDWIHTATQSAFRPLIRFGYPDVVQRLRDVVNLPGLQGKSTVVVDLLR
jgi:hypothetical protein